MADAITNVTTADIDPAATRIHRPELILQSVGPFDDFQPTTNARCFCGSGVAFGRCCGAPEPERAPPYGVFVVEHYIQADVAQALAAFARQTAGERLKVIDRDASTPDNIVKVEDPRRVSERLELGPRRAQVNALVSAAYLDLTRRFIGCELDWYEAPELMRYRAGGLYIKHADSQNMDPATHQWKKVIDRDLSLLLYLNDDYEGGTLWFEKFNFRLRPRAGMAVLFPSDHRYVHAAEQVTQGERYVIVSWASARGVAKIGRRAPEPAIPFN